ncbi:hypothetical protein BH24ACT5_BH24ACT5_21360 [soil metagenome]
MVGAGRIGGVFFTKDYAEDVEPVSEYCSDPEGPADDDRAEAMANFTLSMCLIGATFDESMEVERTSDDDFTADEMEVIAILLPGMLASCDD